MLSQVATAQFFFSMTSLEKGELSIVRTSLEVCLSCLQPAIFFVACLQLCRTDEEIRRGGGAAWGASWLGWTVERVGKAALGCYIFHYFFTPSIRSLVVSTDNSIGTLGLPRVVSGSLQLLWTLFVPAAFVLLLAPVFQMVLTGPFLYLASKTSK